MAHRPVRRGSCSGRGILLDLTPHGGPALTAAPWEDRVTSVSARATNPPAQALLIRPDGHVAWAAGLPDTGAAAPEEGLTDALARWFGPKDWR